MLMNTGIYLQMAQISEGIFSFFLSGERRKDAKQIVLPRIRIEGRYFSFFNSHSWWENFYSLTDDQ